MTAKNTIAILAAGLMLSAPAAFADMSPKDIYAQDSPAVVLIMAADQSGKGELGSGSIIDEQGRVLTNAHVITNKATGELYSDIEVYFKPARLTGDSQVDLVNPVQATVIASNQHLDLALLSLSSLPANLHVMPIGDSSKVSMGDPVVAIGHPEEGGLWTMTSGIVSTVMANLDGVQGKNVFQTDASINRGNSGGPLIDRAQGAMIGVNTAMARKAPDGLAITSVNFSIESSVVKHWLRSVGENLPSNPRIVSNEDIAQASAAPAEQEAAPQSESAPAASQAPASNSESAPAAQNLTQTLPANSTPAAPAPAPANQIASAKPAADKPAILTPKKPYSIQQLIAKKIAAMERMGNQMQRQIDNGGPSANDSFNELDQESGQKIPNSLP